MLCHAMPTIDALKKEQKDSLNFLNGPIKIAFSKNNKNCIKTFLSHFKLLKKTIPVKLVAPNQCSGDLQAGVAKLVAC